VSTDCVNLAIASCFSFCLMECYSLDRTKVWANKK